MPGERNALYIGGFTDGQMPPSLRRNFTPRYDHVDDLSFREAYNNPDILRQILETRPGLDLWGHSAACVLLGRAVDAYAKRLNPDRTMPDIQNVIYINPMVIPSHVTNPETHLIMVKARHALDRHHDRGSETIRGHESPVERMRRMREIIGNLACLSEIAGDDIFQLILAARLMAMQKVVTVGMLDDDMCPAPYIPDINDVDKILLPGDHSTVIKRPSAVIPVVYDYLDTPLAA